MNFVRYYTSGLKPCSQNVSWCRSKQVFPISVSPSILFCDVYGRFVGQPGTNDVPDSNKWIFILIVVFRSAGLCILFILICQLNLNEWNGRLYIVHLLGPTSVKWIAIIMVSICKKYWPNGITELFVWTLNVLITSGLAVGPSSVIIFGRYSSKSSRKVWAFSPIHTDQTNDTSTTV